MSGAAKRPLKDHNSRDQNHHSKRRSRDSEDSAFDWEHLCCICGSEKDSNKNRKLTEISRADSSKVQKKLSECAAERGDNVVLRRVSGELCLFTRGAKYHRECYKKFTSCNAVRAAKRSLEGSENESPVTDNSLYLEAAESVLRDISSRLENGEIFLLPDLCCRFKTKMSESSTLYEETVVKSHSVKTWLRTVGENRISFFSRRGKADIVCSRTLSVGLLLEQLASKDEYAKSEDCGSCECSDAKMDESRVLYYAAQILRNAVEKIPVSADYFSPKEILLEPSKQFVPPELLQFAYWLIDKEAGEMKKNVDDVEVHKLRRVLTICECIIYCSRRKQRGQVIPPFHLGLMVHLQHEYGKKNLIGLLHSFGLCPSHDELRRFMTALATEEIAGNPDEYIPSHLLHRTLGGALIHEGDDNVDINVETIDGKDTYHSMARVIFQQQPLMPDKAENRIPRGRSRSLGPKSSMKQFVPHSIQPPSKKPEPPSFSNEKINHVYGLAENLPLFHPADITWVFLRNVARGMFGEVEEPAKSSQKIPFWTGFNTKLTIPLREYTVKCYAPTIDTKPADISTMYTTLLRGKAVAHACGQDVHIHTHDQQLFAVAQQVKLLRPAEFNNAILMLGTFHLEKNFIGCIGKLWGDSGLSDLLSDSGVFGTSTVKQILVGNQFHRAKRALTLTFEVLMTLLLENFNEWLSYERPTALETLVDEICAAHESYVSGDMANVSNDTLGKEVLTTFESLLSEFREKGREKSATFRHWDECLRAISLLLCLTRAEREGDWNLYLTSRAASLIYFFACDHPNYARWAPLNVLDMLSLPEDVAEDFKKGLFSVKFTPGAFRGLPTDLAVEMSVIRDTKSDSGIVGFTRKESAVLRWTVTKHLTGEYSRAFRVRSGDDIESEFLNEDRANCHEQETKSFLHRDEADFHRLINHFKSNMTDPFSLVGEEGRLVNISSGLLASDEVQRSLLGFRDIGLKRLQNFMERLTENSSSSKKISFYKPITKCNVKTFSELYKSTPVPNRGQKPTAKVISAEVTFQRALAVKERRNELPVLEEALKYPMNSVPPALFKPDGTKRFTDKSDLLHCLENFYNEYKVQSTEPIYEEILNEKPKTDIGSPLIWIVDAMAELQKLHTTNMKMCDEVAEAIFQKILDRFRTAHEVHYVFDRYDEVGDLNPKSLDRVRRYGFSTNSYNIKAGRPLPPWKKVLSNNKTKASLIYFLCEYFENARERIPSGKVLCLGGGYLERQKTTFVTNIATTAASSLSCNHTEADTRLIFHFLVRSYAFPTGTVYVESPDTDVFLLLLAHYQRAQASTKLWFYTGKGSDGRRFIPIHSIHYMLYCIDPLLCLALLILHSLTGTDTNSSLFYIGKAVAFQVARKTSHADLESLINLPSLSLSSISAATKFISRLYDPKDRFKEKHYSINSMRAQLAITSEKQIEKLPPSEPALYQHIRRAAWQSDVWLNAFCQLYTPQNPLEMGWELNGNALEPIYFEGPTSLEVLQDYYCACKGRTKCQPGDENCNCQQNGMDCCDLCSCKGLCLPNSAVGHNQEDSEAQDHGEDGVDEAAINITHRNEADIDNFH